MGDKCQVCSLVRSICSVTTITVNYKTSHIANEGQFKGIKMISYRIGKAMITLIGDKRSQSVS